MSGRGGVSGRGAILRMLQDSDGNETVSSSDTTQIGQATTSDSGLGSSRSAGRGRFLFDTTDDADGSAKALSTSKSGSSFISEGTSGDVSFLPKPTSGRGKLLQLLKDETTVSFPARHTEEKVEQATEQVEALKIETEMEPVIRRGTKGLY